MQKQGSRYHARARRPRGRRAAAARTFILVLALALLAAAAGAAGARAGGSSKQPTWIKQWAPASATDSFGEGHVARSGNGDLFVAGIVYHSAAGRYDWCVARYLPTGKRMWVHTLAQPAVTKYVYSVAADASGNVIVAGYAETAANGNDWLVAKWSRAGRLLWTRQIDGSKHEKDVAVDCAAAPDGSVVVVGSVTGATTFEDGLIIKYSPKGKTLWRHQLDGASHSFDGLHAVAVDAAGNAYAAGFDYTAADGDQALLVRYSPKGKALWTRRQGVAEKHDEYADVAVSGAYVACAGYTMNDPEAANWEGRGLVAKYGVAKGSLKWARPLENPSDPLRDLRWSLVGIDAKGRVAVAGNYVPGANPSEHGWLTTVYSAAGTAGTVLPTQGSLPYDNIPLGLVSTPGGTVYVVGTLAFSGTNQDLYVLALGSTGAPRWGSVIDDPTDADDLAYGVAATATDLFVGGSRSRSLVLVKYKR
jgi:hypothetical protein